MLHSILDTPLMAKHRDAEKKIKKKLKQLVINEGRVWHGWRRGAGEGVG
jgi:hypothetical protein